MRWGYSAPCGGKRGVGGTSPISLLVRTGIYTGTVGERGWSWGEGQARARARRYEKRRRGGSGRGKGGNWRGREAEVPVTARYGSLGDRCRYRVAISPESVARSPLRHFSLARSLAYSFVRWFVLVEFGERDENEEGWIPVPSTSRVRAGSIARSLFLSLSLSFLRSLVRDVIFFRGRSPATFRAALKGSIDRAKHGGYVDVRPIP